ncbi:MAG: rhomboid family intramembrane serine protease [Blautia sp.]|nr:rhomboid family intramembrane serine protease [Blautia sp.]
MRENKPYVTYLFLALNIIVFFVLEKMGSTEYDMDFMIRMGAVWPENIRENGEYWRLLTAAFLHFGFEHLLNNMLLLFCAGPILERAMGHVRYFILYLCAAVGGCSLSYLYMLRTEDYAVSAGASGAIFGVIAGLLWVVVQNRGHYETLTDWGILFMIVLSLYIGITSAGVDNWGHIGGLLTGSLLSVILYRKKPKGVEGYEN